MQHITIKDFSNNVAKHINDRNGIIVTQDNHESCVVVPLSTWESMNETIYLLGNEANAEHLKKSLQQAKEGKFVEFTV